MAGATPAALPQDVLDACPEASSATKTARLSASLDAAFGETFLLMIESELRVLSRSSLLDPFVEAKLSETPKLEVGIETALVLQDTEGKKARIRVGFSEEVAVASLLAALASKQAVAALAPKRAAIVRAEKPVAAAPPQRKTPLLLPRARDKDVQEIVVRDVGELRGVRSKLVRVLAARARAKVRADLLGTLRARPAKRPLTTRTSTEIDRPNRTAPVTLVVLGVGVLVVLWILLRSLL